MIQSNHPYRTPGDRVTRPVACNRGEENTMSKIIVTEFMSLDGVMEEPRWTFEFDRGPDGDKFKFDELFDAESLLLGRVTYQGFAAAWPSMGGDDFGKRMNSIHKYVVSSTLNDAEAAWGSTTVIRQDPIEEIAKLRDRSGGNLLVEGSAQLVHGLARNGLVDEYRLMVFPVVLGRGKRVFPEDLAEASKLTLADSRTVGSGVLLLTCHPAGK
jgi:dihydrofolate reductase